jgi:hypothetical protein
VTQTASQEIEARSETDAIIKAIDEEGDPLWIEVDSETLLSDSTATKIENFR